MFKNFPPRKPTCLKSNATAVRDWLAAYLAGCDDFDDRSEQVMALMMPHIDYERGRSTYRAAYSVLRTLPAFDLLVMFGTAHKFHPAILHGTRTSFEMPLGHVQNAFDVMTILGDLTEERIFLGEGLHQTEWAIELPLLIVQQGLRPSQMPPMVPLIASCLERGTIDEVLDDPRIENFLAAISATCDRLIRSGLRLLFVAGVDLSHVGSEFGDAPAVGRMEREIEARDRNYLGLLAEHRGTEALDYLIRTGNPSRIDAGAPMYFMLDVLKRLGYSLKGELVCYAQSPRTTPQEGIVTHATTVFRH